MRTLCPMRRRASKGIDLGPNGHMAKWKIIRASISPFVKRSTDVYMRAWSDHVKGAEVLYSLLMKLARHRKGKCELA